MPYPRIHITNVRGHGIPPCPLCVFPPGGACSPHRWHRTHRTHLGGYGIPAIPTPPSANPPTEFTEFTEVSGGEYSPTDFTDAHRLGGYGIPATPTPPSANPPTEFTEFTEISGVEEPPTDAHRCSQMVRLRRVLWLLWEDSLVSAWVWQDAIPSYSLHCLLCWCTSCSGKRQSRAETSAPP